MENNKIIIDSSSLAAYSGFNKYVDSEEATERFKMRNPIWCKQNNLLVPEKRDPILDSISDLTDAKKQKLHSELRTENCSDEALATAVQSLGKRSAAAPQNSQSIEIIKTISEPSIRTALELETRKERGTKLEASSRKRLRERGMHIETAKVCLTKHLRPLKNNTRVLLVGRLDGSINKNPVELKERRSRLFGSIPIYEKVQLHAYMFLSETNKSTLVESYDGNSQAHECEFDQDFWDEVMDRLYVFLESV